MTRKRQRIPDRDQLAPAVALFATLAHPMRLQLLMALAANGPMSAGALQEAVDAEQSAVSHQLAALRRGRLVEGERDGRHMMYRLVDHHVAHIVRDAVAHAAES